jgi:hypothetical protein
VGDGITAKKGHRSRGTLPTSRRGQRRGTGEVRSGGWPQGTGTGAAVGTGAAAGTGAAPGLGGCVKRGRALGA